MPLLTTDLMNPDGARAVSVALEPAHNIQHSLLLLARADEVSGFDPWVYRTVAEMTPEERDTHELVMIGLHYATRPDAAYPSFPAFVEQLAGESPLRLRNKVLDAYIQIGRHADGSAEVEPPTYDDILLDVNTFLAFLRRGFGEEQIKAHVERRAYTYLIDPPAMQQLIVGHLRAMWYKYLAVEWERVRPMLQKAVRAFEAVDLSAMDRQDAAEYVVGRSLRGDKWCEALGETERLVFVPSAHIGPYTAKYNNGDQVWLLFGARQPDDAPESVPELSRAELLVRLSALADDTRLSILKVVADQGELRSQDIMQLLDVSQSGASRHLQQLTAAGFLHERRCNGAKCYVLNGERLDATLQALGTFLAPATPVAAATPVAQRDRMAQLGRRVMR